MEVKTLYVRSSLSKYLSVGLFVLTISFLVGHRLGISNIEPFDDAYLYLRYAYNLRDDVALSWNRGGPQIQGMTSLLYQLIIATFPAADLSIWARRLIYGSFLLGSIGSFLLVIAAISFSKSRLMTSPLIACVLILSQLYLTYCFQTMLINGMETSLAFLIQTGFIILVAHADQGRFPGIALITAITGYLSILTRPESLLCVIAFPTLLCLKSSSQLWQKGFFRLFFAALLGLGLIDYITRTLVFGDPWPLPFYAKSFSHLEQYLRDFYYSASQRIADFSRDYFIPILLSLLGAFILKNRFITSCVLAFSCVALYLCSACQIMGWGSRYYMPYLPYLLIGAYKTIDLIISGHWERERHLWKTALMLMVLISVAAGWTLTPINKKWQITNTLWRFQERTLQPVLERIHRNCPAEPATYSEPRKSWVTLVSSMAPDGKLAATELGYIGAAFMGNDIIDLTGLNDKYIAQNGFSADYVFSQTPDLIFLPHIDYISWRYRLVTHPRFSSEYVYFPNLLRDGVAINRNSRFVKNLTAAARKLVMQRFASDFSIENCADLTEAQLHRAINTSDDV